MSGKMEAALQFPLAADLKDLAQVEGNFSGRPHCHGFASISFVARFYCICFTIFWCFPYFVALQPEWELDLAQLAGADTQEAAKYGKKHTLELLRKIQEQLSEVGLQAAALPEDQAQKYILAVSLFVSFTT